jgi:3-oxoacyl-[acyl-carrier protein] reductase
MSENMIKPAILITGASRGIGKAIATVLAREGYSLHLCCRHNIDLLQNLASELTESFGITCHTYSCDVGNEAEVTEMFAKIRNTEDGMPGIVINNAGVAYYGLLTDMSADEWHEVVSSNLDSVFYICKNAVPDMVRTGNGRIINISSVWGNVGASCEVAYSASKGGVNSFTRALAKELAPSNIQVNAIACGVIDTDMNRKHLTSEDLEELEEEIPAGRMGDPLEVADLVLRVSESPFYLTGQVITLDGGWI